MGLKTKKARGEDTMTDKSGVGNRSFKRRIEKEKKVWKRMTKLSQKKERGAVP